MNLEHLTEEVWKRLQEKPRALLIGSAPIGYDKYNYVNEKPYEAVVLGELSPGELLHMPSDAVCCALLEDIPVYLSPQQIHHRAKTARALCRELYGAEQRLRLLGVRKLEEAGTLVTADRARAMRRAGESPPPGCRLTPLARDILEGKAP